MLQITDAEFSRRLRNNEVSPEGLRDYLLKNFSVFELADELAGYLLEDQMLQNNKIVLTPRQQQVVSLMLSKITRPLNTGKGRKPVHQATIDKRNPDESM